MKSVSFWLLQYVLIVTLAPVLWAPWEFWPPISLWWKCLQVTGASVERPFQDLWSPYLNSKENDPSSVNSLLLSQMRWPACENELSLITICPRGMLWPAWEGGTPNALCSYSSSSQFPLITHKKTTWEPRFHKAPSLCFQGEMSQCAFSSHM